MRFRDCFRHFSPFSPCFADITFSMIFAAILPLRRFPDSFFFASLALITLFAALLIDFRHFAIIRFRHCTLISLTLLFPMPLRAITLPADTLRHFHALLARN
jgi:hypothetical protein